jgi:hypothetical protein
MVAEVITTTTDKYFSIAAWNARTTTIPDIQVTHIENGWVHASHNEKK